MFNQKGLKIELFLQKRKILNSEQKLFVKKNGQTGRSETGWPARGPA